MTSEERNRKMKYGHDIPRSWIADFQMSHQNGIQKSKHERGEPTKPDKRILKERYELKRRSRLIGQRRELSRLNYDIRALQKAIAILFAIIGLIAGGPNGFGIGAGIGLALLAFRLEL
jgi:hypothetical protein